MPMKNVNWRSWLASFCIILMICFLIIGCKGFCKAVKDYYSAPGKTDVYWVKKGDFEKLKIGMTSGEVKNLFGEPLASYHWGGDSGLVLMYQTGTVLHPGKVYLYFGNDDKLDKIKEEFK